MPSCVMRLNQVPSIAVQIDKDSNRAILLLARLLREPHPARLHLAVIPPEVIRLEKQENTSAGLIADPRCLFLSRRTRQDKGRPSSARADDDPPFPAAQRSILHDRESQALREVFDCLVILADEQSNRRDLLPHRARPPSKYRQLTRLERT